MKIILKQDVRDLGREGEVVEVKEGYARNYLLPKKLAVTATEAQIKDLSKRIEQARQQEERERQSARQLGDRLRETTLTVEHRASEGTNRLHGSVTSSDIAQAIQQALGVELDRRNIDLRQPIRSLGEYTVNVKLVRGVTAPIRVVVKDPTRVEEEPAPAEAPAEAPAAEAPAEGEASSEAA